MPHVEHSPNLLLSNKRKNIPDGLWNRCEVCGEITFSKELERNLKICPKCGYHYPMSLGERIKMLIAVKNFTEYEPKIPSQTVVAGEARLNEYRTVLCIIDLPSVDGSELQFKLTKAEYKKILYAFNQSLVKSLPLITFYSDGTIFNFRSKYTAPIYKSERVENDDVLKDDVDSSESLSLTFLINLAATVEKLSEKRIPHITVLTNPRFGGEFCTSFPLGDIVLAEPKPAHFVHRRLRLTVHPKLADNSNDAFTQNASENYFIDKYVNRGNLRKNLLKILSFCLG